MFPSDSRQPSIHVSLTDHAIDLAPHDDALGHPDTGAHAWFQGVTRRTTGDQITQSLFYEAKRSMAISQLRRIAEQAAERFSLFAVVIVHRLGEVPVGQASIALGCSSAHRVETFAALAWIMDEVKRDVPIWKRDLDEDGNRQWIHPADVPETTP